MTDEEAEAFLEQRELTKLVQKSGGSKEKAAYARLYRLLGTYATALSQILGRDVAGPESSLQEEIDKMRACAKQALDSR